MLSAALITKGEVGLKKCIASFIDYVDEVVIVSNKPANARVKKIAQNPKVKLFEREWTKNFSEARNFAFGQTTGTVDFWVDSDDTVENADQLPKLAKLIHKGDCDWISLEYIYATDEQGNVLMRHYKPRLTRKNTGVWKCAIHENFEPTASVGHIRDENVRIVHHIEPGHEMESAERNLEYLQEEANRDGDKTDPRTLYYLGMTLMEMKEFEGAAVSLSDHVRKCGWPEEKYFSMHYLSHCLSFAGHTERAINIALESLKIFPEWALAYFDLGEYYSMIGGHEKAVHWLLMGLQKQKPDPAVYFINDLDYTLFPLGRLADAYLSLHKFDDAWQLVVQMLKDFPGDTRVTELAKICKKARDIESFVNSFVNVAGFIRDKDRLKAVKLFENIPAGYDADIRIQQVRQLIVPAKKWGEKSIVIYCHSGLEDWAPPSLLTGIGGSEEAVINMAEQFFKQGYAVTVYCRCGDLAGNYKGVEYVPYYHFNPTDSFDTLIIWRYPSFLTDSFRARKVLLWLHDIVAPTLFNDRILKHVDKILFMSKWHRNNVPDLPEEKCFVTGNGLNPLNFEKIPEKLSNSLIYTSSYDRGAVCLGRDILPLMQKEVPGATLDIAYGMDNITKEMDAIPYLRDIYNAMSGIFKQPGVTHHGRMSQERVIKLQGMSVLHAYPTEFGETFNISSIKAQAAGTYVLTTTQSGATPEYIRFGEVMKAEGIYSSPELQKKFAARAVELLKNPPVITEEQRQAIITEFSWENRAKEWIEKLIK